MNERQTSSLSRRTVLQLSASAAILLLAQCTLRAEALVAARREQPFNGDWRFLRSDGEGLASPSLDDSAWRSLDLPHDWSIEDLPGSLPRQNTKIREADTAPLWQPVKNTPHLIGPFDADLNRLGGP